MSQDGDGQTFLTKSQNTDKHEGGELHLFTIIYITNSLLTFNYVLSCLFIIQHKWLYGELQ